MYSSCFTKRQDKLYNYSPLHFGCFVGEMANGTHEVRRVFVRYAQSV